MGLIKELKKRLILIAFKENKIKYEKKWVEKKK